MDIEIIIVVLFFCFAILPMVFSMNNLSYKESLILGNGVVLFLLLLMLVMGVLVVSFNHIAWGGISLYDAGLKIINSFK